MKLLEKEEDKIERLQKAGKSEEEIVKILKQDREKLDRIKAPYIELYGEDSPEILAFLNMFNGKSNTFKLDAMKKYVEEAGEGEDRVPLLEWMDNYLLADSKIQTEVSEEEEIDEEAVEEEIVEEPKPREIPKKEEVKVITAMRLDKHSKNASDHVKREDKFEGEVIYPKMYIPKSKRCSPNAENKVTEEKCKVYYAHSIKR